MTHTPVSYFFLLINTFFEYIHILCSHRKKIWFVFGWLPPILLHKKCICFMGLHVTKVELRFHAGTQSRGDCTLERSRWSLPHPAHCRWYTVLDCGFLCFCNLYVLPSLNHESLRLLSLALGALMRCKYLVNSKYLCPPNHGSVVQSGLCVLE